MLPLQGKYPGSFQPAEAGLEQRLAAKSRSSFLKGSCLAGKTGTMSMSLKGTAMPMHGEHLQGFFLQQATFRLGVCHSLIPLRCPRDETFTGGQAELMSSNQLLTDRVQWGCYSTDTQQKIPVFLLAPLGNLARSLSLQVGLPNASVFKKLSNQEGSTTDPL